MNEKVFTDNDNELDPKPQEDLTPIDINAVDMPDIEVSGRTGSISLGTIDITSSQETTRAYIALLFTRVFLIIVATALIGPFVLNIIDPTLMQNPLDTSKNLVTLIASVLAGPFGFIVGFYYKQGNQ